MFAVIFIRGNSLVLRIAGKTAKIAKIRTRKNFVPHCSLRTWSDAFVKWGWQASQAHVTSVLCKLTFAQESRCRVTSNRWFLVREIKYWGLTANAKYHYSYLFFYRINKEDLPLMYSCVFWLCNNMKSDRGQSIRATKLWLNPRRGGWRGGTAICGLFRCVPLWRVWYSSSLL